jgi:non-canonical purine NTP pyrophosphatase (RdgB/HAM1 family)
MYNLTFITGNQGKADLTAKWLGRPLKHHKLDLDEIQSLDVREVAAHKARQACSILKQPVLIEDVALTFTAMGQLPGTLIRWFLEELGNDGLCRLADSLPHREVLVTNCYALHDGKKVHFFEATTKGTVAPEPRGDQGFGWNPMFIPEGSTKTFGEMDDDTRQPFSARFLALEKLKAFLEAHDK